MLSQLAIEKKEREKDLGIPFQTLPNEKTCVFGSEIFFDISNNLSENKGSRRSVTTT